MMKCFDFSTTIMVGFLSHTHVDCALTGYKCVDLGWSQRGNMMVTCIQCALSVHSLPSVFTQHMPSVRLNIQTAHA